MEYIITRTSVWDDNASPYGKATQKLKPVYQERTLSEEEFDRKFSGHEGLWRSKGTEHSVTSEGYIRRRDTDKMMWVIEINTLEELNQLHEEVGDLVITSCMWNGLPQIEIYDNYRE